MGGVWAEGLTVLAQRRGGALARRQAGGRLSRRAACPPLPPPRRAGQLVGQHDVVQAPRQPRADAGGARGRGRLPGAAAARRGVQPLPGAGAEGRGRAASARRPRPPPRSRPFHCPSPPRVPPPPTSSARRRQTRFWDDPAAERAREGIQSILRALWPDRYRSATVFPLQLPRPQGRPGSREWNETAASVLARMHQANKVWSTVHMLVHNARSPMTRRQVDASRGLAVWLRQTFFCSNCRGFWWARPGGRARGGVEEGPAAGARQQPSTRSGRTARAAAAPRPPPRGGAARLRLRAVPLTAPAPSPPPPPGPPTCSTRSGCRQTRPSATRTPSGGGAPTTWPRSTRRRRAAGTHGVLCVGGGGGGGGAAWRAGPRAAGEDARRAAGGAPAAGITRRAFSHPTLLLHPSPLARLYPPYANDADFVADFGGYSPLLRCQNP
jgi:hypothetical protein